MEDLPRRIVDRVVDESYLYNGEVRIWDGRYLRCKHGLLNNCCRECGRVSYCVHNIRRTTCRACGGGSFCQHGVRRNHCKECGGVGICKHGKVRSYCKKCDGASICDHGIQRSHCKECDGGTICDHGNIRNKCKECGGSQICDHGRPKSKCKECGGAEICQHDRLIYSCMICDPHAATATVLRSRVSKALKANKKSDSTMALIGCSIEECRKYLEQQFVDGMTWENHGEWHIDHRRPCASFDLVNAGEQKMCFHYTNLQPMWGRENLHKNASFDEDSFEWEWDGSQWVEMSNRMGGRSD